MIPSAILPGTYFLCGPINEKGPMAETMKLFSEKQNTLIQLGFKVFNPLDVFKDWDIYDISISKFDKYQYSCLAMCDKVITINEWEQSAVSKKIVDIARIMEKEIISYSAFILKNTGNGQ